MRELLVKVAHDYRDAPIAAATRHFVRGMLAAHALDPALHRALLQQLLQLGLAQFHEEQAEVRGLVEAWLTLRGAELQVDNPRVTAFVVVAAVESVIHAAVLDEPALLADPAFEEEVVRLVLRYLGVEPADPQRPAANLETPPRGAAAPA
jgi:hypothetical protein